MQTPVDQLDMGCSQHLPKLLGLGKLPSPVGFDPFVGLSCHLPSGLVRVLRVLPPIESRRLVDGGLRGWIRITESPAFVSGSGVCGVSGAGRDKWDAAVIVRGLRQDMPGGRSLRMPE